MRKPRFGWRYGLVGVGLLTGMALAVFATVPSFLEPIFRHRPAADVATIPVQKLDLNITLTAGGRVESSESTVIQCELENLAVSVRGNGLSANGSSTILSVVPDGSVVKKGDILCVLDSSDYEELYRQQQMNVDRARADCHAAELTLDVAKVAVSEYRDGQMLQALRDMKGQIALARSDFERSVDRIDWTKRMLEKGYLSKGQLISEELALKRQELSLQKSSTGLKLFNKFYAPKYIRILESDVMAAEAALNYQQRRVQRHEERLAYLKRQIENCTIRAPHDGFVIHANEERREVRIEPGLVVRQMQRLFYLPDLSRMEVVAMVHESVVDEVKPGQKVSIRVEGLSNRLLEGHVDSVAQLPTENWFSDVKYFAGVVKIDTPSAGLKPGMSAEVEIQTAQRGDVLAVPAEAVSVEDGHEVCYVAHDDTIERREVVVGRATRDLLEICEGLDLGDEVVVDPEHLDPQVVTLDREAAPSSSTEEGVEPSYVEPAVPDEPSRVEAVGGE